jgi:preprotein translocase subunit YajC
MDFLLKIALFAQANIPGGGNPPASSAPQTAPVTQAQGNQTQPQPSAGGSMLETLIFFGVIFLVFWLLIIRPQQKKTKQHGEFVKNLKRGDSVVTAAGICGRIVSIEESTVIVEIAKDVKIKVLKNQVAGNFSEKEQQEQPK